MRVISKARLRDFYTKHPKAKIPLLRWHEAVKRGSFRSFAELRATFPSVDRVGKRFVFNIGGNNFRLIAAIHFNRELLYVRQVLTHKDYDKGEWK